MDCPFQIGDVVQLLVDNPDNNEFLHAGDTGTAVYIDTYKGEYFIGVDWGRDIEGHSCNACCEYGNGWNVDCDQLTLAGASAISLPSDFDVLL